MSRRGMSVVCGPCQLPQQRWKRMRSLGMPLMAWLSASTRRMENLRYSSTVGFGIDHVPILGDGRIIELQNEARIDNGLVFLAHGIGTGKEKLLLGPRSGR